MTTKVRTETGKVLEVKDFFNNNGKGAYDGKVLINGKEIYTHWFFGLETKKITFLTSTFSIDGQEYRAQGDVIEMSLELKKSFEGDIKRAFNDKMQEKGDRMSQMFGH